MILEINHIELAILWQNTPCLYDIRDKSYRACHLVAEYAMFV